MKIVWIFVVIVVMSYSYVRFYLALTYYSLEHR